MNQCSLLPATNLLQNGFVTVIFNVGGKWWQFRFTDGLVNDFIQPGYSLAGFDFFRIAYPLMEVLGVPGILKVPPVSS